VSSWEEAEEEVAAVQVVLVMAAWEGMAFY
jgi:hypothetical protein